MEKPTDIKSAVKALRTHLGETQQVFSGTMDVSLNTIARWETNRRPGGKWLMKLAAVARQAKRKDLARHFEAALSEALAEQYSPEIAGKVLRGR